MNRLFISLNIPKDVINKLLDIRNSIWNSSEIRWEPDTKLHVTLKFIGDVDQAKTDKLVDLLSIINEYESLNCSIEKFGFFFRESIPTILWAGLVIDEKIFELVNNIDQILSELSIITDKRKFKPHITLLRLRKDPGINFVNKFKNFSFEPILFQANSVTLYKSILERSGSKYHEIKKYHLK